MPQNKFNHMGNTYSIRVGSTIPILADPLLHYS